MNLSSVRFVIMKKRLDKAPLNLVIRQKFAKCLEKVTKNACILDIFILRSILLSENFKKMEFMLIMWIQDMIHKNIPETSAMIREKALNFNSYVIKKYEIVF